MSLADYFDELQAGSDEALARYIVLSQEADPQLVALSFSPVGGWDSDVALAGEQLLRAITDDALFTQQAADIDLMIFVGLRDVLVGVLARMEKLDPPDQAADPHTEMVAAVAEWAEVVTDITNALTESRSANKLTELLTPLDLDRRLDAIHVRFESACMTLQAVADLDDRATFSFSGPWVGGLSFEDATADFACEGEG